MDNNISKDTQTKSKTDSKYTAVRVTKSTAGKIKKLLQQVNKKDYGQAIKIDTLVNFLVTNVENKLIEVIQESSLSEEDKFKRDYKEYCSHNGKVSIEEFYKLVRQGVVFQPSKM